jgi:hypothetical protein
VCVVWNDDGTHIAIMSGAACTCATHCRVKKFKKESVTKSLLQRLEWPFESQRAHSLYFHPQFHRGCAATGGPVRFFVLFLSLLYHCSVHHVSNIFKPSRLAR